MLWKSPHISQYYFLCKTFRKFFNNSLLIYSSPIKHLRVLIRPQNSCSVCSNSGSGFTKRRTVARKHPRSDRFPGRRVPPPFGGNFAMRKFICLFTILVIAMALYANVAHAQGGKGSVAGHVTDSSGSVLQGAQIELQPGPVTTVSGP